MRTNIVFFPFDLFGGGTAAGVRLLADEIRNILDDNRQETAATRADAYRGKLRLHEMAFDRLTDLTDWRADGRELFRKLRSKSERTIWLGGNHLAVLPVYDALVGCEDLLILQLDAHLDIHHFADSNPHPTHANFLLHVDGPLPPLVNVGHRELLLPAGYVGNFYQRAISAVEFARDPAAALAAVQELCADARYVYLDLDCDVLDPAFFPAVTDPMPFGLSPLDLLRVIEAIGVSRLSGLSVSEFDPGRDSGDRSLATLIWLLEHLWIRWHERT